MRWGLTVPLMGVPLTAHADLVRALPAFGYTDLWSAETNGADAFTPLALASTWEPTLRLGTAIVPVYTRGPALIAMSAATMAAAAPGRFVLGLGASSPGDRASKWNGIAFDEPYRGRATCCAIVRGGAGRRAGDRRVRSVRDEPVQAGTGARPAAADPARRRCGRRCCASPGARRTARS